MDESMSFKKKMRFDKLLRSRDIINNFLLHKYFGHKRVPTLWQKEV